jgi:PAS domain S-box-containing protein/putative nucleotidyltransferase with HDIG domain
MVRKKPVKELAGIKQSTDDALIYAENIIDTVREPLVALDQDLRVVKVNRSFCETFKVKPEDTLGQLIYDLGNKQWAIPRLRELLEIILPQKTAFDNYEVEHDFATIGSRVMLLNAREIHRVLGKEKIILLAIEDITERRQAEKLLAEKAEASLSASEEKYRLLVENINDVFYVLDNQGNITYISPAVEQFTGYKVSDLIGKPFTPIIYPDDLSGLLDSFNRLASGHLEPWEFRVMDKDGNILFVRSSSKPIYKDGQITGFTALMIDITERKRAEDEVTRQQAFLRQVIDSSPNLIFVKDRDNRFLLANIALANALGTTPEYIQGKTNLELGVPADESAKYLQDDIAVLQSGKEKIITDESLTWQSGEVHYYHTTKRPLLDEKGEFNTMLAVCVDITDRKKAEAQLWASDVQYQLLANSVKDAIWLMDMELKFLWLSPSCEKLRGYTIEEMKVLPLHKHLTPESFHRAMDLFARAMDDERQGNLLPNHSYVEELEYSRKDGSTFWVETNMKFLRNETGKATSILFEGWDITERKLFEDKLLKSYESLQKTLNDAINTMVKIVELRDPYTAGHQNKVADLATSIAGEMKVDDTRLNQLQTAALLHDIGKMYVPSDILSKPGKLSQIEFGLIKTHSQSGYDIVKSMNFPGIVAEAVLQHHERLDGSGYPNQLKGEDTLLEAKILAVADVVEAMASHRPYRPALGIDKALEEISKNKGKLYDPDVVATCLELFKSGRFEFK